MEDYNGYNVSVEVFHWMEKSSPSIKNLKQGLSAAGENWDVQVHNLGYSSNSQFIRGIVKTAKSWKTIIQSTIRERNPDIVVIHKLPYPDLVGYLFEYSPTENFLFSHDNIIFSIYDAIYIDHPKKTRQVLEKSDLVYSISKEISNNTAEWTDSSKIAYIPPSVDTQFFNPNLEVPQKYESNSLVLGWVGNIDVHYDNVELLAERLRTIGFSRKVKLRMLTGGGTLPNSLYQKLSEGNYEIDVIDYVPWAEVPKVINSLDIGLAPLTPTPFNKARSSEKVREYMACGIPVVASNVGENSQLITKETGFLANSNEEWDTAISELYDQQKRALMGKQARNYVVENYSIPVIGEKINENFSKLITDS